MLTRSDDAPHRAGDSNSLFDFNPSFASSNDLLWDAYSKSEKSDMEFGSNLSRVVEHGNSDENFWQFRDAFSDVQPEPKLVSYFHLVVLVIIYFSMFGFC